MSVGAAKTSGWRLSLFRGAHDIRSGEIIDGHLPKRAASLVKEWMTLHRDELIEMWETQEFKKLDSLE
jgi:hypothetical protein